ncbi:MAG: glycosyltransferase [Phycisphaerae bacterium]|nr:glycosyltransferase [Phycisphaerae bacterium]
MSKRILQLITDLAPGGAPLMVKDLAIGLQAKGFDSQVACLGVEDIIAYQLRQAGVQTHCLGAENVRNLSVVSRLYKLLRQVKPDILHCHLVHANIAGRLTGQLARVPKIIATIHTAEQEKRWHLLAERLTCRLSAKTVCVSDSVREFTHKKSHVPAKRLVTIYNGIDIDRFARARAIDLRDLGLSPQKKTLIFTGRLHHVKGVDILIEAFARICLRHDLQLIIAGDGSQRRALEELVEDYDLGRRIVFIGMRADVPALLKAADLFVLPSYWEGFGLSAVEAMAAEIPVIASDTFGLIDIIEDEKTGLLVAPGEPDLLAAAIETLIENPVKTRKMVSAAMANIKQKFTLDRMVQQYINLYTAG